MEQFISEFGKAMVEINQNIPGHENAGNIYQPGIGPYGEDNIVDMAMEYLTSNQIVTEPYKIRPNLEQRIALGLRNYVGINGRAATPDLVIGNKIIEFKKNSYNSERTQKGRKQDLPCRGRTTLTLHSRDAICRHTHTHTHTHI